MDYVGEMIREVQELRAKGESQNDALKHMLSRQRWAHSIPPGAVVAVEQPLIAVIVASVYSADQTVS